MSSASRRLSPPEDGPVAGDAAFGVVDLEAFLIGEWRLERTILDHRDRLTGSFSGTASFEPEEEGLRCWEAGRMTLGHYSGSAGRDTLYRFPAAHLARVLFPDRRPFHDLDLRTGCWAATHLCPPDRYDGRFEVFGDDHWRSTWEIRGPRKAAQLITLYRR